METKLTVFFVSLKSGTQNGGIYESHCIEKFEGTKSVSDFYDWLVDQQQNINNGKSMISNCKMFTE